MVAVTINELTKKSSSSKTITNSGGISTARRPLLSIFKESFMLCSQKVALLNNSSGLVGVAELCGSVNVKPQKV